MHARADAGSRIRLGTEMRSFQPAFNEQSLSKVSTNSQSRDCSPNCFSSIIFWCTCQRHICAVKVSQPSYDKVSPCSIFLVFWPATSTNMNSIKHVTPNFNPSTACRVKDVERQTEDKQSRIHNIQSTSLQSHNLEDLLVNPLPLTHSPFNVQTDQDRHVCIARGGYVCTRSLSHICRDSEGHPNNLLTAPFHMTACTASDQG
jgi:hypothetical protein